jgi:hypothetical protein
VIGKHLRTSAELERQMRAAHQLRAETLPLLTRNQLLWLARGAALGTILRHLLGALRGSADRRRDIPIARKRLPQA